MMIESGSQMSAITGIASTAVSTDTTTAGAIADRQNYNSLSFINGISAYTDGTFTPLVNESDASNMSGETAVADAELSFQGSNATPEASAALSAAGTAIIDYIGSKRYVTCDIVSTETDSGATIYQVILLSRPRNAPVA